MTVQQLLLAIERHMAQAEMHMETAHALLEEAFRRELKIEPDAETGGWVQ